MCTGKHSVTSMAELHVRKSMGAENCSIIQILCRGRGIHLLTSFQIYRISRVLEENEDGHVHRVRENDTAST